MAHDRAETEIDPRGPPPPSGKPAVLRAPRQMLTGKQVLSCPSEAAMPSHHGQQRETKRRRPARREQGLVLDDFLAATYEMRRDFKLRTPQFGLQQIEHYPNARESLKKLIQATIDRHGTEICAKPDPLLSEISVDIYSERIVMEAYSGWRISPNWISQALRKLLEKALQTVVQLPRRVSKPDYSPKKLRLLASRFSKLAEEADIVLQQKEAQDRARAFFSGNDEAGRDRLLRAAEEMRWAATTLTDMISNTKLVKTRISSPNPQVRFALYIAQWFQSSTDWQQYRPLEILITAAFSAAGKETPKWVGRLGIEKHLQGRRRQRHFSP